MTLIAFIPILWGFSDKVPIPILKDYEGSLVWGALAVSFGGLIISWFVGVKLPGLEYNNQRVETAFRKDLVLREDNNREYAQPETLFELFTGIITPGTMVQISNAFQKVHGGFALFLHNWTTITELRSIYMRLHEFEHNLRRYEKPRGSGDLADAPGVS
jgi:peptide/bleomycin uptake transporter